MELGTMTSDNPTTYTKGEIWNKPSNHTISSMFIHNKHPDSSNKETNTNNLNLQIVKQKKQQDSSNRKSNIRRFIDSSNWKTNTRSNTILQFKKKDDKYLTSRV
jgi:hypothetical protein